MPKVIKIADCGNSPKNLLVQALAVAIETSNATAFGRCVSEDVVWAVPGRRSFDGKAACLAYLKSRKRDVPKQVRVRRAISHGRAGAADGVLALASGFLRSFCHVVDFASAKGGRVSRISTYYSDLGEVSE
jgi:hypothetical protein